jgi:hypothetical protein
MTSTGETLAQLSLREKVLVVFLRHGGCPFCREALQDISVSRHSIERKGTTIVLVHMMTDEDASALFDRYGLGDLARISDPDRLLYGAFGLQRGTLSQLLGWKVWWRGLIAGILNRHGAGSLKGDGRQMPGVFLLKDGEIIYGYRHRSAADRPSYPDAAICDIGSAALVAADADK